MLYVQVFLDHELCHRRLSPVTLLRYAALCTVDNKLGQSRIVNE